MTFPYNKRDRLDTWMSGDQSRLTKVVKAIWQAIQINLFWSHDSVYGWKYCSLSLSSAVLQPQTNKDNKRTSFKIVHLPFIKTNTLVEISAKPATVALHVYFPALSKVSWGITSRESVLRMASEPSNVHTVSGWGLPSTSQFRETSVPISAATFSIVDRKTGPSIEKIQISIKYI